MTAGAVATAAARPVTVQGVVKSAKSRWTADGSRIVTEAVVATATGDVTVSQLGGTAEGVSMITIPGPPILSPGMVVAVAAREAMDLSSRSSLVVEDLQVTGGFEFVRTTTKASGKPLYWKSGCVQMITDLGGTTALAGDLEGTVVSQSMAEWNTRVASCSYMNLVELPRKATEVGRDFVNVIKFRDQVWGRPAIGDDPARNYGPSAAGLTTVSFVNDPNSSRDGEIMDADVELNGVHFAISASGQSASNAPCKSDLANTLTHELGHVLGLEHTCLAGGDPDRVDDKGNAVPACAVLPEMSPIREHTMYNFQECSEIKKADLHQEEVNAMCGIYPLAKDPGTCSDVNSPGEGCCSAGANLPGSMILFFGTGLLLLLRRRRGGRG